MDTSNQISFRAFGNMWTAQYLSLWLWTIGIKYVRKQHAQHLISVLKDLAANVGRVMSAGRANLPLKCRMSTFSQNIIDIHISTYIHTDSYVRSRYGKLILCRCDSPMSAKSRYNATIACPSFFFVMVQVNCWCRISIKMIALAASLNFQRRAPVKSWGWRCDRSNGGSAQPSTLPNTAKSQINWAALSAPDAMDKCKN